MLDDHPNGDAIRLLYGADEEQPTATIVLDEGEPHLTVSTGRTDDAVEAQLTMLGTYIDWFAQRTDVPPETVAEDALQVVSRLRGDDFETTEIRSDASDED